MPEGLRNIVKRSCWRPNRRRGLGLRHAARRVRRRGFARAQHPALGSPIGLNDQDEQTGQIGEFSQRSKAGDLDLGAFALILTSWTIMRMIERCASLSTIPMTRRSLRFAAAVHIPVTMALSARSVFVDASEVACSDPWTLLALGAGSLRPTRAPASMMRATPITLVLRQSAKLPMGVDQTCVIAGG